MVVDFTQLPKFHSSWYKEKSLFSVEENHLEANIYQYLFLSYKWSFNLICGTWITKNLEGPFHSINIY